MTKTLLRAKNALMESASESYVAQIKNALVDSFAKMVNVSRQSVSLIQNVSKAKYAKTADAF